MRLVKVSAIAFAVTLGLAGASSAQNVIPGGWSPHVGYQTVAGGGYGVGSPYNGWNYSGYGRTGSIAVGQGYGRYTAPPAYYAPPQTVNNLGGFADTVRQTTRARRSR